MIVAEALTFPLLNTQVENWVPDYFLFHPVSSYYPSGFVF